MLTTNKVINFLGKSLKFRNFAFEVKLFRKIRFESLKTHRFEFVLQFVEKTVFRITKTYKPKHIQKQHLKNISFHAVVGSFGWRTKLNSKVGFSAFCAKFTKAEFVKESFSRGINFLDIKFKFKRV